MNRLILLGIVGLAVLAIAMPAQALTITFDDIATLQSLNTNINGLQYYADMPANYAGYNWGNWEVDNGASYVSAYLNTAANAPPSSPNFIANYFGNISSTVSDGKFQLLSLYVSTFATNGGVAPQGWSSSKVTITGFLNNVQVGQDIFDLTPQFVQVTPSWAGLSVDTVQFTSAAGGQYFAVDNVEVQGVGSAPPPVPEPLTMLAVTAGIGSLGVYVRRKTKGAAVA